ncbi:spinster family MFS transporter [Phenylobacterium aquaticum]|uniref:spinster family MFS transporter n=1 Tax=Phenylobacterium aquaticum TaxID=1763816 RepID=UPI001F5DFF97|nr:MFS transporter [Phenylobacterium aquaticum]MCI3134998.1 MFS transporter [Phenylobacterium aquaticum]
MAASGAADSAETGKTVYSNLYRGTVLALLVTAYTLNFIDRTIISTIGQAIKVDLKITDTQLGLLGGLYFALLYTLLGIPIARIAERFSRVNIIAAAIVIWSGFTALCGTAGNFAALAAYRFGVGFGEAGLSPPAHSLISDYYEPKKRATALSIYSFGIPAGTMIGAVVGGWLAQNFSWRIAFMLVGLPGVIVAILIKLIIKEPKRGHSDIQEHPVSPEDVTPVVPAFSIWGELKELGSVAKTLFLKWPVANMVLGVTIASFGSYGSGQFVPPYFTRTFGLNYAEVGLITGLVGGFSSGIGTILGGVITDRMSKRSARWYALTPAIGLTIATPIYIAAYLQPSWQTAAMILLIPGIFHYTYLGPTFGVVQNMVETRRRATATALLFFFLNLIALGGGPPFTGWLIDHFAQFNFTHPGENGIVASLQQMIGGATKAGERFAEACPGGIAPKGSPAELAGHCKGALVHATREGVIVSLCFYLWAAFHYFLGSFGLVKAMAKARADRGEA